MKIKHTNHKYIFNPIDFSSLNGHFVIRDTHTHSDGSKTCSTSILLFICPDDILYKLGFDYDKEYNFQETPTCLLHSNTVVVKTERLQNSFVVNNRYSIEEYVKFKNQSDTYVYSWYTMDIYQFFDKNDKPLPGTTEFPIMRYSKCSKSFLDTSKPHTNISTRIIKR